MRHSLRRSVLAVVLTASFPFCFASSHLLTVSPSAASFGTQTVSTTTSQVVTVTNSGTLSVTIQSVTLSGSTAFQVSGFAGTITLRPSESLDLNVSFTPNAVAAYSATLSISATGGASKSVSVSGSGTGSTSLAVAISPTSATVQASSSQQFAATVSGTTNTGVTWLVGGVAGGSPSLGTISTTGLYTAPATIPSGGGVTVTAQSVADSTKSANASVTITSGKTVYSNIDDSSTLDSGGGTYGWGWCGTPSCAGGSTTATQMMYWGQQPSLDGGSAQFMVSGNAWADGLWWYKLGANDSVANFQFDFWLNVSQPATTYAQALEFDFFQYVSPERYMFGTECNYSKGYNGGTWDVWNSSVGSWIHTSFACPGFVPGDWYHITWSFNRSADLYEHYNTVAVQHYDSTGTIQLDSSSTSVNMALPSGPLPSGWTDNLGVQFQLDINGVPGSNGTATYTTLVDKVTLTAW